MTKACSMGVARSSSRGLGLWSAWRTAPPPGRWTVRKSVGVCPHPQRERLGSSGPVLVDVSGRSRAPMDAVRRRANAAVAGRALPRRSRAARTKRRRLVIGSVDLDSIDEREARAGSRSVLAEWGDADAERVASSSTLSTASTAASGRCRARHVDSRRSPRPPGSVLQAGSCPSLGRSAHQSTSDAR